MVRTAKTVARVNGDTDRSPVIAMTRNRARTPMATARMTNGKHTKCVMTITRAGAGNGPAYEVDGLYGSRWDTTVGTFGDPLTTATGAYNPAVTDRGFLLTDYPVTYQYITFRVWAFAPAGNCTSYQATLYTSWGGAIASSAISSGGYWQYALPAWAYGVGNFRVVITYAGATGTTQSSGTVTYYIALGAGRPPTISTHPAPAEQTVSAGTNVTYSVTASDATSFQWQKDGAAISGANTAVLALANVQNAGSGTYRVSVSNANGATLSNSVSLNVTAAPPTISTQPMNVAVSAGQSATFTVGASGASPLTYQWRKAGAAFRALPT